MSRSLSIITKAAFPSSIVDCLFFTFNRRGYAAVASQAGVVASSVGGGGSSTQVVGKVKEVAEIKEDTMKTCSTWVPDPVTGYYKPSDCVDEIDPAELRQLALKQKIKSHISTKN